MAIKTVPFDAAEFLVDSVSQDELLSDALETGDSAYVTHALRVVARARGLTSIMEEPGDPKLSTVLCAFRALGLKLTIEHLQPSTERETK